MMVNVKNMVCWDVTPRSKRGRMEVEGSSGTMYVHTKPHGVTPKKTNFMRHVLDSVVAYLMMLFQLSRP